jgi:predicted MFS family arabinose efflux permease
VLTDWLGWRWIFFVNVPVGIFAFAVAAKKVTESRDPNARRTDVAGLATLAGSLFLIVYGLLRGNTAGWSSAEILGSLLVGLALLGAFVLVEVRQERPMLDVSLFLRPGFLGIQLATFFLGAGMFALFPYLSIYLQDIDGNSPLGAGLRFLPITVFVFIVPLLTRSSALRVPMWALLGGSLAIIAGGLLLMNLISVGSSWRVLLPGFIVTGIGIGLANPAVARGALQVVEPTRTGMASGISNTCRIGGLAMGVAALGAVLQHHVGTKLAEAGYHGNAIANAVSSSGLRAAGGDPRLAAAANEAFVSGLRLVLLVCFVTVLLGSVSAFVLLRRPAPAPERRPAPAA